MEYMKVSEVRRHIRRFKWDLCSLVLDLFSKETIKFKWKNTIIQYSSFQTGLMFFGVRPLFKRDDKIQMEKYDYSAFFLVSISMSISITSFQMFSMDFVIALILNIC